MANTNYLDPYLVSELPPEFTTLLNQHQCTIKDGITQTSRLVAWSWSSALAFEGATTDDEKKKLAEELVLKKVFIEALVTQAAHTQAYIVYGDVDSKNKAKEWSQKIFDLFAGNKQTDEIDLTLAQVLKKLSNEDFIFDKQYYPGLIDHFTFYVCVDTQGKKELGQIQLVTQEGQEGHPHFLLELSYCTRPVFGEATIMEETVRKWAKNQLPEQGYFPPPGIPILNAS